MNVNEAILREKIDPFLTEDNLNQVCTKSLGIPVKIKKTTILTGGCLNRVIVLNFKNDHPELVLKISPDSKSEGLKHEFDVLHYFYEKTSLPVPEPIYFSDDEQQIPGTFYLMKKIPGVILHQARLSGEEFQDVIRQLANIVSVLHLEKSVGFGGVELKPEETNDTWSDFWLTRFNKSITKLRNSKNINPGLLDRVEKIRDYLPSLLEIGKESTLTHYDIWAGNVLLTQKDGCVIISGFLDTQGFWADYARELSFMELFGLADHNFYNIYTTTHTLDDNFIIRKNLYNLKMNLIHINMYPEQMYYRHGAINCLEIVEDALK
jgi:fructosamine-3-kinase